MSEASPKLTLVHGGKDMLEVLEETAERVKRGELLGLVLCTVQPPRPEHKEVEPTLWWTWAHHEGLQAPFALLLATLTCAQHTMLEKGLS